jgi:hypothetical protein
MQTDTTTNGKANGKHTPTDLCTADELARKLHPRGPAEDRYNTKQALQVRMRNGTLPTYGVRPAAGKRRPSKLFSEAEGRAAVVKLLQRRAKQKGVPAPPQVQRGTGDTAVFKREERADANKLAGEVLSKWEAWRVVIEMDPKKPGKFIVTRWRLQESFTV